MWDMKRVFEVMDQIQADKRDEYRNMTPEEVHDHCMADFLVATMRVHREERGRLPPRAHRSIQTAKCRMRSSF